MRGQVPEKDATKYGCLVVDKDTNEALHYAEKPETFVSDIINAGIYILSPGFFDLIEDGDLMDLNFLIFNSGQICKS